MKRPDEANTETERTLVVALGWGWWGVVGRGIVGAAASGTGLLSEVRKMF